MDQLRNLSRLAFGVLREWADLVAVLVARMAAELAEVIEGALLELEACRSNHPVHAFQGRLTTWQSSVPGSLPC